MNKSIYSNVKAGAHKLYKGARSLYVEEGLGKTSFNNAVDKVTGDYIKHYNARVSKTDDAVKGIKDIKDSAMGVAPKNLKILGKNVDNNNANKILEATADRMALSTSRLNPDDTSSVYNGFLKKTKGAIAMNTAGSTAKGYYYNPIKNGITNFNSGNYKQGFKDTAKAGVRIGSTAAIIDSGLSLVNSNNYEDW